MLAPASRQHTAPPDGGVLATEGLVAWTDQPWRDLLVGVVVSAVAVKGRIQILREARGTMGTQESKGGANA